MVQDPEAVAATQHNPEGLKVLATYWAGRSMPRTEFAMLCLAGRLVSSGPEAAEAWDNAYEKLHGHPFDSGSFEPSQ